MLFLISLLFHVFPRLSSLTFLKGLPLAKCVSVPAISHMFLAFVCSQPAWQALERGREKVNQAVARVTRAKETREREKDAPFPLPRSPRVSDARLISLLRSPF